MTTPARALLPLIAFSLATSVVACKSGPTEEQVKTCNDAKAQAVKGWGAFADAAKKAVVLTPLDEMTKIGHDAMLDATKLEADSPRAKLVAATKAAEAAAEQSLAAATKAAEALQGAEAKGSAELAGLSQAAATAVDKAKSDGDKAREARAALAAHYSTPKPTSPSDNPRIKELEKKRLDVGADLAKQVVWENARVTAVFPLADAAKAGADKVGAACAPVEVKK